MGLLDSYFYMNYWQEGPHVRLRLKPRTAADEPAVREAAEAAVRRFLADRPALYEMNAGFRGELHKMLFRLEYPNGGPQELLAADGTRGDAAQQLLRLPALRAGVRQVRRPAGCRTGGVALPPLQRPGHRPGRDDEPAPAPGGPRHRQPADAGDGGHVPARPRRARHLLRRYHQFWRHAFGGRRFRRQHRLRRHVRTPGRRPGPARSGPSSPRWRRASRTGCRCSCAAGPSTPRSCANG